MHRYFSRIICALALFVPTLFASAFAVENTTYKYDALGRVIESTVASGPNNGTQTTVTYDPAGNRSNYKVTGAVTSTSATLSIGDASVTEGGTLVFTVTRGGNTSIAASANYASANGSATAGNDYTAVSGTLSFAANETSKTINVATIDDAAIESAETLTVSLSSPGANTTISTATSTGTINDNDVAPATLSIGDASVTEGATLVFTVTRGGNTSIATSASYVSANGSAASGSDYTAVSGTVNFAVGETSKTISASTIDDAAVESVETLMVSLSSPGANTTISTTTGTGTINDNDVAPATLSIGDASVTEGGTLVFTVTRGGNTSIAASANYASANGSATAGNDYTAVSGTLSFAANETSKTINVATIDDAAIESAETLTVSLSSPGANTTISTATGTGTINDNDVSLSITSFYAASEGTPVVFTVTRSGSTANVSTSVNYATANGSAIAGVDYIAASGTLSFAAGEFTKTIAITTIDDSIHQPAETLTVALSNATGGATISTASALGSIFDSDVEISMVFVNSPPANEGSALTFSITRTGYISDATDVNFTTADGTATAGVDYTPVSGTLNFASDETTKTITVPTIDDSVLESTETLTMALSNATGSATILTASATATLYDNDSNAPCELAAWNREGNDEFTLTVGVQKNAYCSEAFVVGFSVAYISGSGQYEVGSLYGGGTVNPIDSYKTLPIYPYFGTVPPGSPLVLRVTWYVVSGNATIVPYESIVTIYNSDCYC